MRTPPLQAGEPASLAHSLRCVFVLAEDWREIKKAPKWHSEVGQPCSDLSQGFISCEQTLARTNRTHRGKPAEMEQVGRKQQKEEG